MNLLRTRFGDEVQIEDQHCDHVPGILINRRNVHHRLQIYTYNFIETIRQFFDKSKRSSLADASISLLCVELPLACIL